MFSPLKMEFAKAWWPVCEWLCVNDNVGNEDTIEIYTHLDSLVFPNSNYKIVYALMK